jgi:hypothetical protein
MQSAGAPAPPPETAVSRTIHDLNVISPAVLDTVFDALDAYHDQVIAAGRLRWVARIVCQTAHARNEPIEHMLAKLKPEWARLLDSREFPRGAARTDMTNRFISLCIEEFYLAQMAQPAELVNGGRAMFTDIDRHPTSAQFNNPVVDHLTDRGGA